MSKGGRQVAERVVSCVIREEASLAKSYEACKASGLLPSGVTDSVAREIFSLAFRVGFRHPHNTK